MSKLADFSDRSIVWLVETVGSSGHDLLAAFRRLHAAHFPRSPAYVLARDISPLLRVLMMAAHRRAAPYDVLVRIDLTEPLTHAQIEALAQTKAQLPAPIRRLFLTRNIQFQSANARSDDVAMAFINTWPSFKAQADAQEYWLEHHGPLVVTVGLPSVITSYTQVHFDLMTDHPDLFERSYQGLSFETITSQHDLAKAFVGSRALRKLNRILLRDEENFTGPPLFFAFKTLWAAPAGPSG